MTEEVRLHVVQGHLVRDRDDNEFGIVDFNPDPCDPAVLLMARESDGPEGRQRICRPGSVMPIGRHRYTVTEVHTQGQVYVDLVLDRTTEEETP